jgi:hypothetical protein
MNRLWAIDPGPSQTAFLTWLPELGGHVGQRAIAPNDKFLSHFRKTFVPGEDEVAVEMIACYGMPVGRETFETCLIIGRIQEICEPSMLGCRLVYRKDVKMYLCGSMKAKDGNIRQALIDKHGKPGTKKTPGKTYGISSHLWAALAIADYALNNPNPRTP